MNNIINCLCNLSIINKLMRQNNIYILKTLRLSGFAVSFFWLWLVQIRVL